MSTPNNMPANFIGQVILSRLLKNVNHTLANNVSDLNVNRAASALMRRDGS